MPWTPESSSRYTKKARTAKQKRMHSHIANSMLKRGYPEGAALRIANGVVKRASKKRKVKRGRSRR